MTTEKTLVEETSAQNFTEEEFQQVVEVFRLLRQFEQSIKKEEAEQLDSKIKEMSGGVS